MKLQEVTMDVMTLLVENRKEVNDAMMLLYHVLKCNDVSINVITTNNGKIVGYCEANEYFDRNKEAVTVNDFTMMLKESLR